MPEKNSRSIFITGVTDGLGLAMVELFHDAGYQVYGLGRRPYAHLETAVFTQNSYCQLDLNEPDVGQKVRQFFQSQSIQALDFLVHNAGVGYYGRLATQPLENIEQIIQVNLKAPIQLTHALLPLLRHAKGQVTFVSSVATNLPTPDYAVYTATKKALEGFARSLKMELKGQVQIQVLQPGASKTGMHKKLNIPIEKINWQKFPSAMSVAAKMKKAIEAKRSFAAIGISNKLIRRAGQIAPALFDRQMARKITPQNKNAAADKPVCLITGAADGIGKALAQKFGADGFEILGVDIDYANIKRTKQKLMEAGTAVSFIQADLSTKAGMENILINARDKPIDLVIHNAGINAVGSFEALPLTAQERVVDVNFLAPIYLTTALFQNQLLIPQARFIFLSSLSYFVSYPGAAVYAATKDGVANFARQLMAEYGRVHPTLTVFPGPTRTTHAARHSPDNSREAKRMPAPKLAEGIFNAYQNNHTQYIPGTANKIVALIGKMSPSLVETMMSKAIYDKLDGQIFV